MKLRVLVASAQRDVTRRTPGSARRCILLTCAPRGSEHAFNHTIFEELFEAAQLAHLRDGDDETRTRASDHVATAAAEVGGSNVAIEEIFEAAQLAHLRPGSQSTSARSRRSHILKAVHLAYLRPRVHTSARASLVSKAK